MKRIFIIISIILCLPATYSFAQMGHGMMRDSQMMGQGPMMDQKDMTGERHMLEHGRMMDNMTGLTQDMSAVMNRMSEVMGNVSGTGRDLSRDNMHRLSNMMRDISSEMNRMSWIMDKGIVTDEEMKAMHDRMTEIQKQIREIMK